jgi:hypothetical protein
LNDIMTKARQVDELAAEVAKASGEQTQGIAQINSAVGQMDKVTQSDTANAEESAAAAEELNAQAEVMKQSVAELLQTVDSKRDVVAVTSRTHAFQSHTVDSVTKSNRLAPTNGNGNDHHPAVSAKAAVAGRRSEILMDGDFKDF